MPANPGMFDQNTELNNAKKIVSPNPQREITHQILKKSPSIWHEEIARVCYAAVNFLNSRKKGPSDAIIFDIDGTLIADETHCILPVKALYHVALDKGYYTFIITARPETLGNQLFTTMMLEKCGIEGYSSLFMRPPEDLNLSAFKESRRKTIFELGFNSIMSVGDMPFDFGAYGGISVQIPTLPI